MTKEKLAVVDFETEGIEDRPNYPPKPVGVSLILPGQKPKYYAWGHPEGNNCSAADGRRIVRTAWQDARQRRHAIAFHHGKFDQDVAETHMGCAPLPYDGWHDSMFSLFLTDPHANSLSLKPSAQRVLGMKPDEQDRVRDWIIQNIPEARKKPSTAGAYICRAPAQIVGPYANGDTLRTLRLHQKLYPEVLKQGMGPAYDRERKLMHILLDNERQGIRVDVRRLRRDLKLYLQARHRAEMWLGQRLKVNGLNFDSDAEVADALHRARIVKAFKLTEKGNRSTSKKNLTPDMFSDPRVASALGYRNRLTTCIGTFMEPWLLAAENDGYIRTSWNQVRQSAVNGDFSGTKTGRPSSRNPNFLNVPKDWYDKDDGYRHPSFLRVPELPLMRRYLLPDEGGLWLHRDYNQQELRIAAHYEGGKLCEAYKANPRLDVHAYVAEEVKRIRGREIQRRAAKITMFRKLYGGGATATAISLRCSIDEARSIIRAIDAAMPDIKEMNNDLKARGKAGKPIRTWGGRLYYCEPPKIIDGEKRTFEYKLINYLIQSSAADATKESIIRYHAHPKKRGRFLVTVYDENDVSAPKKVAKQEDKVLTECMEGLEFDVPMLTDGKMGRNWLEAK